MEEFVMRDLARWGLRIGAGLALASMAASCGSTDVTCADTATCSGGPGGGGGSGGIAGAGGVSKDGQAGGSGETSGGGGTAPQGDSGNCNGTESPAASACVIDSRWGVFVSPAGNDTTGSGAKDMPFKTIGKGLQAAKAATKRLYVCDNGTGYGEQVT